MPLFPEVAALLIMAAAAGYWIEAFRSKERACDAARRACEQAQVQFLDDTVQLARMRLRRDSFGRLSVYREYRFEFTADSTFRDRGEVAMQGRRVLHLSLGPYRVWEAVH